MASWDGALARSQSVGRALAVALLGVAVAAGRLGVDDELENLAPALVVGAAWPLLVAVSASIGPIWRWSDPWDGLARSMARNGRDEVPSHVWPAVALSIAWVWYLSAYPDPLGPRSVGTILALYTLATVAGCLAAGRARWLAAAEPLGIVLSWMALLPRRRLPEWRPPHGAEALLGVLAGGVLFGAVRRSELWGTLNLIPEALLVATLGVAVACGLVAALFMGMARGAERPEAGPLVARAAVPAVAGIVVAVALDRNRLFTSVQLLPGLLGDPFGWGWDLLGRPVTGLDPAPLGAAGLATVQLVVLLAGHLAGALVLAQGATRRAREPAIAVLSILALASVIAVSTH